MNKIHVVIPVYNVEKYLEQAVRSVLDQPYKGIDIVLVDDGSPDNSPAICDRLAAECDRIEVIHKENGGVSSARNVGIEYILKIASDEDFIVFLDADDFWVTDCITDNFFSKAEGICDMYALGSMYCNETGDKYAYAFKYEVNRCAEGEKSIWDVNGTFCSCLYSVKLFQKWGIRFPDGLKYCEDKIFLMQCIYLSDKVSFMTEVIHVCRENIGSAMKKVKSIPPIEYYLPIIEGWIKSDEFVNKWSDISGKVLRSGRILAGIYLMDMTMDHYKRWGSRKQINKVLKNHPNYNLMLEFLDTDVKPHQCEKRSLLLKHPFLFKLKYNFIGAVEYLGRKVLRIKAVSIWRENRRYPLTQMPVNKK